MARLNDQQIDEALAGARDWRRQGDAIVRDFDRGDFKGSVDFLNAITPIAEEMNHHPDVSISWSTVTLTLSTHSAGGLTENDFELAKKIDAAAQ